MKKSSVFILMTLIFLSTAFYHPVEAGDAREAEVVARDLLEASGLTKMGEQTAKRLISLRKKSMPNIPDHFWKAFAKEIDPNELNERIVPIYVKHFSVKEMKALIAFYKSDVGKKFLGKLPEVTKESMAASRDWNNDLRMKLTERLKKADLKKKE